MSTEKSYTGSSILIRIESSLTTGKCGGTITDHATYPSSKLSFQLVIGIHSIDQTHSSRFVCIIKSTGKPHFPCLLLSNQTCHMNTPISSIETSHSWTGLSKDSILSCQSQVGTHMKYMSTTNGISSDHCHNGLGTTSHLYLQVQDSQPSYIFTSITVSTRRTTHSLISTGTKGGCPFFCIDNGR